MLRRPKKNSVTLKHRKRKLLMLRRESKNNSIRKIKMLRKRNLNYNRRRKELLE